MQKTQTLALSITLATLLAAPMANAVTWCPGTEVKDVICYSDKSCFITVNGYGGTRYYKIDGLDNNKNAMVALATTALATKGRLRLAFVPDALNCADVPQNTQIYGVGLTELF